MRKFSKYSHQKTSSTKEGRLNHFQRLKGRHTDNSFILVGPHNHSYLGGLAIEFQPLSYQKKKPVINCQQSKTKEGINMRVENQATNANNPQEQKQKMTEIIELSDSGCSQPTQDFLSELPLVPVYNADKKYYTPTFLFPNANSKDEQCHKNFMHKIQEAKRQIVADQIMQPRPRNKHLYCGVCKQPFDEYLGHVRGKTHQDKSRKSPFAQHIKTLELQMNIGSCKKEREKQWKRNKSKEERMRKKEEEKKMEEEGSKKQMSQQQKKQNGQKEGKALDCKLEANNEGPQQTSSSSSSSTPKKVKKQRKPRQRRQKKKDKKRSSSSKSSSESRSRQKKVRRKQASSSSRKKGEQRIVEPGKKKRGRPSKKDLQLRKRND